MEIVAFRLGKSEKEKFEVTCRIRGKVPSEVIRGLVENWTYYQHQENSALADRVTAVMEADTEQDKAAVLYGVNQVPSK